MSKFTYIVTDPAYIMQSHDWSQIQHEIRERYAKANEKQNELTCMIENALTDRLQQLSKTQTAMVKSTGIGDWMTQLRKTDIGQSRQTDFEIEGDAFAADTGFVAFVELTDAMDSYLERRVANDRPTDFTVNTNSLVTHDLAQVIHSSQPLELLAQVKEHGNGTDLQVIDGATTEWLAVK